MNTELKASNLLLNRGIRFNIPNAPFWDRLMGRHQLWIKPLKLGTIIEMSRLILESGIQDSQTNIELLSKCKVLSKVIAIAVLNDKNKIASKTEKLSDFILWKIPSLEIVKIYRQIEQIDKIEDFMIITSFFLKKTSILKKRMGQKKGS